MNQDFLEAAHAMFCDLVAGGIDRAGAHACALLYLDALNEGSERAWARFYRGVAGRLEAAAARGPLPPGAGALRTLLDDDFGSRVIDAPMRERVRAGFVEQNLREASLSS